MTCPANGFWRNGVKFTASAALISNSLDDAENDALWASGGEKAASDSSEKSDDIFSCE